MRGSITHDWYGNPLDSGLRWSLCLDDGQGVYEAYMPFAPVDGTKLEKGDFVEGLWEHDVVELFLAGSSGRYVEFNVSAQGAWWFMAFADYRKRTSSDCERPEVSIQIDRSEQAWQVQLQFELTPIVAHLGEVTRVQIAGIHHATETPVYLSSRTHLGGEPDFHHPSSFSRVDSFLV